MNRLLRLLIIGLVSLFGGLVIWAATGNIANNFGEVFASIWFIACMFIAGYCTHKLLPAPDNSDLISEEMYSVCFDQHKISCINTDGNEESLRWGDLQFVEIVTSDDGPWFADIVWVLSGKSKGLAIPQGADGDEKLLERLQELPNFNDKEVIKAMSCTSNKEFLVWSREN